MKSPTSKSFRSVWAAMSHWERIAFYEQIALFGVMFYALYLRQPSVWVCFGTLPMLSLTLKNKPGNPKSTPASKRIAVGFFFVLLTMILSASEYFEHPHRTLGHILVAVAVCLSLHMFFLRWKDAEEQETRPAEVSA